MERFEAMRPGIIEGLQLPVTVWDLDDRRWHHNPSIARDKAGKIWVSTRHHEEKPAIRYAQVHPYSHPTSWLMLGVLDEETLRVSGVRRIKPDNSCPIYIQEKEIEDVRIYWREDGLHGIGVAINSHSFPGETRVYEMEILIDPVTNTYKLIKDYGYDLRGHMEKNWTPPSHATPKFDFIYSQTEVVLKNKVCGTICDGQTHGGSQALPYKDGWIRIAHRVVDVGITHRWYVSVAELMDADGYVTHTSQFFDLCTGWRPQIRESVEFVSGAVWCKGEEGKRLLVSYGVRDETCGFVRIPVSVFKWEPFDPHITYDRWQFKERDLPTHKKYLVGKKFFTGLETPEATNSSSTPFIVMYKPRPRINI